MFKMTKTQIYIKIFLFILLLQGCSSSGNPPLDKEYSRIDKQTAETNRLLNTFNSIEVTLDDSSTMTAYYHNGELKKLHIAKKKALMSKTRDCYFHKWKVIYISDVEFHSPDSDIQAKYYFKDDSLIGWERSEDLGRIRSEGTNDNKKEKELMSDIEAYLLLIQ